MELISVIIPAYNVEKYLSRCLDSVCGQTYKELEIIVIDDGSTDATAQISDDYAAADPRVKVVHKKNGGVAAARNTALDMVCGAYVAFADADDYMEPDMLEKLYAAMNEHCADMVSCGYYEEYSAHTDKHGTGMGTVVYDKYQAYEDYFRMGGYIGSGCWNKLMKKKVLEDVRYKDYVLGEDVEMLCRALDRCEVIVCIDHCGYHYIHREDSATRTGFGEDNIRMLKIADEMLGYIRENHPELIKQMYAFHAAWHSAQIQVMYWCGDTRAFTKEKRYIRKSLRKNMSGYCRNPYMAGLDRLVIYSFLVGIFGPVRVICGTFFNIGRRI